MTITIPLLPSRYFAPMQPDDIENRVNRDIEAYFNSTIRRQLAHDATRKISEQVKEIEREREGTALKVVFALALALVLTAVIMLVAWLLTGVVR